jgi:hypothetical protein
MIRDALRVMLEWYVEDGKPLPRPNPRARAKKAKFMEKIDTARSSIDDQDDLQTT